MSEEISPQQEGAPQPAPTAAAVPVVGAGWGAIFALYNRALRVDPTLEGKLVLRLTIAPTGEVTFCEIVSSELGDLELERKLVQRVRLFRFEARDVEAITTTKPIDFFPA